MALPKLTLPDSKKKTTKPSPESLHEKEVEKGLSAIYRDEAGELPDLKTFEPRRSRWWVYALCVCAGVVLTLGIAAWLSFVYLKPFKGFNGQGLALTIEGPDHVSLGQDTTYFINYHNIATEPLAQAEVRISFPSDFVISSRDPQPNTEDGSWRLGAIGTDGGGTITIHGTFTGALGTVTAIQVVGTYHPASFNSDFEALGTKAITYSDSVLQGSLETPVKVLPGDKVALLYHVQNNGSDPISSLVASFTLPDGFEVDSSSTQTLPDKKIQLPIPSLAAGASTTIAVTGTFASSISGEAHVIAEAGHLQNDGSFLASQHSETSFSVLAGDLSLKLVANGTDSESVLSYGGLLSLAVAYENTADEDLGNVRLHLHLDPVVATSTKVIPALVNWKTYNDNVSAVPVGNVVTWSKDTIAALDRLPPNEDGSIQATVQALQTASGTPDVPIRAYVEAEIGSVGKTVVQRVVRSAPILIRYVTDASFTSEARYSSVDGAPVGSGPLPPIVGQGTTYRMNWNLQKTRHELKDLKMTATLPDNVTWTGTQASDAGTLSYDSATHNVTWTLNRLPETVNHASATFDLQLTPTASDANRFAKLLGQTSFTATDAAVNQSIAQSAPALSTDLQNDETAQGKGVVRQP